MATMDAKLNQLVDTVWARFQEWPETKRFCEASENKLEFLFLVSRV